MGKLLINKVTYKGENYTFESPNLRTGLNIIEGKNGNGKSTFTNMIYYCLSGKVAEFSPSNRETHSEITKDKNNSVTLDITLNDKSFTFIRFINSNDITILSDNGEARVYPIFRSKNEKEIFSDWILNKLGIEPVEVFQGITNSKINFRDLLRLVYHNQELNPKKIFKPGDVENNFVSDSVLIRKIIFELLIGKTFADYYSTLAKLKETEKDRNIAKGMLEEYISFTRGLPRNEDLNLVFLKKAVAEKEDQLNKLYIYRNSLKDNRVPKGNFYVQINEIRSEILTTELSLSEKNREYNEVVNELAKLKRLRENVILEVTQISKIIHSHEKLSLFSADTCPYCLREVTRQTGHCVCGNEVDEEQYERFFYSSEEYSDILKSKQKSIDTIDIAISACQEQTTSSLENIERLKFGIENLQQTLSKWIEDYEFTSSSQEVKQADDKILEVRSEINDLYQQIDSETKRDALQQKFKEIEIRYEDLKTRVRILEGQANADIKEKVMEFNEIYNKLMTNTLKNCRSASIGFEDYMPIIDGGTYKEASASVTIRLMYFFTLLKLSLDNRDVKYPRFLLIDTPETAGVDTENLSHALAQLSIVEEGHTKDDYQIILTTGLGKYPKQYKQFVLLTLTDEARLLQPVEKPST